MKQYITWEDEVLKWIYDTFVWPLTQVFNPQVNEGLYPAGQPYPRPGLNGPVSMEIVRSYIIFTMRPLLDLSKMIWSKNCLFSALMTYLAIT